MKLILAFGLLALAGCASVPANVTTVYSPPMLGNQVGDVIRIEQPDYTIFIRCGGAGGSQMQVFPKGK